jgi:hypothetical protein
MLTKTQLKEIDDYMDTIKVGFRCVCSFCQAELPHSDRSATKISHGMCSPLCEPAKAMGWGDVTKPTLGAASLVIGAAIVMLSFVSCAHASWDRYLDALALVESNNNPSAIGDKGKSRGAYQIQLAVWRDVNKSRAADARLPFETGSHGIHARAFAFSHLTNLHARLVKVGINPSCVDLYAAWNLGFTGFKRRGFDISRCPVTTQRAAAKLNQLMK